MNTLSGGLVTAVAPVVIQVGFTTKMIQTDMAIWKMDETDMTIFMMGEKTWPVQYQHLCISGHSLGSALAYWISRKQRWPTNFKVLTHITTLFRVKDYGLVGLGQRWTRENKYLSRTPRWRSSLLRTPGIVKGNNPLSLVWFKWGSWWGILKHFPQSRCILISHWSREKKQSSFII